MFHLASSLYTQYTKREQYNILILGLDNAGKTTFLEHVKLLYPSSTDTTTSSSSSNSKSNSSSATEHNGKTTSEILKSKRILPTVGQNTTTIKFASKDTDSPMASQFKNINLKFWDLGGQKSLRSMWSRYFKQCHGIIFIIDSTDTDRFQECYETLIEIANDDIWMQIDDENDSMGTGARGGGGGGNVDGTVNVPVLMLANKQDLPLAVDLVSLKTGVFIRLVSELEATDSKLLPVSVLENQGLKESLEWLVTRLIYNKRNKKPEYK
ncbi:ADP-ribosylation factor-like protein 3 [Candida viswanathii]|uniref:ADP-ribosylation factor-like protein 3 n=1 Tax=Candida viswanathii TaxID=5486 RepID=A0A367XSM2_9ASCO|nr:ADP-ribosylation factor-like protein 3 [Candida viswanathii]